MKQAFEPILPRHLFENFPPIIDDLSIFSIKCAICLDICRDAMIENACGHTFCKVCLEQLFKSSKDGNAVPCPETRQLIKTDQVGPNRALRELILHLKIKCVLKECNWQGRFGELNHHLKEQCMGVMMKCTNTGCTFVKKRKHVDEHLKECLFQSVICSMCENSFLMKDLKKHKTRCPNAEMLCPFFCRQIIKRGECNVHYEEVCVNKTMVCQLEPYGCQFKTTRNKIQTHMKESFQAHINLLKDKIEEARKKWSVLNSELGIEMEDSMEIVRETVEDEKTDMDALIEELRELERRNESLLEKKEEMEYGMKNRDLQDDDYEEDEMVEEDSYSGSLNLYNNDDFDEEDEDREIIDNKESVVSEEEMRDKMDKEGFKFNASSFEGKV